MAVPPPLRAPIAPQAWPISVVLLAAGLALGLWGSALGAGLCALLALLNTAFFRNPKRAVPEGETRIVAPADGKVVEVERVQDPDGHVADAWRIAIFLSIFDVHICYVPLSGKVRGIRRRGTQFRAAFRGDAGATNVQSRIDLEGADGTRVGLVQITGLIARRIVSYPDEGDLLVRGEPYGLMCYGSRVELYLPGAARPLVKVGDRVTGAASVLAELAA